MDIVHDTELRDYALHDDRPEGDVTSECDLYLYGEKLGGATLTITSYGEDLDMSVDHATLAYEVGDANVNLDHVEDNLRSRVRDELWDRASSKLDLSF